MKFAIRRLSFGIETIQSKVAVNLNTTRSTSLETKVRLLIERRLGKVASDLGFFTLG